MISKRATFAALAAIAVSAPAHAAVTISTAATQNMDCASGTCTPTATNAVLNASDLEGYLTQFGNVHVVTTGSGVEANTIVVKSSFSSPASTSLTLEAHKAITVDAAVSIGGGTAELELQSNTLDASATLVLGKKGHITFGSTSDIFGINGGIFTLVGSVHKLAAAVARNPSGAFAFAKGYDAGQDGIYSSSPIPTSFTGTLEGLGNTISRLQITDHDHRQYVALFSEIGAGGIVRHLGISKALVSANTYVGILAAQNYGSLLEDRVDGQVEGKVYVGGIVALNFPGGTIADSVSGVTVTNHMRKYGYAGGIVAFNWGSISNSSANGSVRLSGSPIVFGTAGGIAGTNYFGTIDSSFATGTVSGGTLDGGLVGDQEGTISDCYSIGPVEGTDGSSVGGLIGANSSTEPIASSYSTGLVTGGVGSDVGGFAGVNNGSGAVTDAYWDTDTSGTDQGSGDGNESGLTGLTTAQLQSGLPAGFDPKIWAENSTINNGLPYLIANPPPK